jgi:alkylation response protein AidB-like acyl-CoA dehydrogenase
MLKEVARLAENELAESFVDADRNPPVYDPETQAVTMPESFKKSYKAYLDSGFWSSTSPPSSAAPSSRRRCVGHQRDGARRQPGDRDVRRVLRLRQAALPPRQRRAEEARQAIIDKGWHCTMVLTEPDAGLRRRRRPHQGHPATRRHLAHHRRQALHHLSAESDMVDNVIHFVLARPEGAGPGTKGLSLFIVPKFHVDLETGELGERNGVYVTNVEKKMGLKVSTTCELTFGEKRPAVGTLLGDVHDGIAQMFRVIENARMMVGTKAIATLSTGYLNALDYAKQRVQGADLTQAADKTRRA